MPRPKPISRTHVSSGEAPFDEAALLGITEILLTSAKRDALAAWRGRRSDKLDPAGVDRFVRIINGNMVAWYSLDSQFATGGERKAWAMKAHAAIVALRDHLATAEDPARNVWRSDDLTVLDDELCRQLGRLPDPSRVESITVAALTGLGKVAAARAKELLPQLKGPHSPRERFSKELAKAWRKEFDHLPKVSAGRGNSKKEPPFLQILRHAVEVGEGGRKPTLDALSKCAERAVDSVLDEDQRIAGYLKGS